MEIKCFTNQYTCAEWNDIYHMKRFLLYMTGDPLEPFSTVLCLPVALLTLPILCRKPQRGRSVNKRPIYTLISRSGVSKTSTIVQSHRVILCRSQILEIDALFCFRISTEIFYPLYP
jgi:hypothetical protein